MQRLGDFTGINTMPGGANIDLSGPPIMSKKAGSDIDRHVGRRLHERRMALGLSQSELANSMGVSFQQIQKYEKGLNRIGAGRLLHAASALQVPIEFFYRGIAVPTDSDEVVSDDLPQVHKPSDAPEVIAIAQKISLIDDPQVRRHLFGLVAAIAASTQSRG